MGGGGGERRTDKQAEKWRGEEVRCDMRNGVNEDGGEKGKE